MRLAAISCMSFAVLLGTACGPSGASRRETLARTRAALEAQVDTPAQLEEHGRLARELVESGVLDGKNRDEVERLLGAPLQRCAEDAYCARAGFDQQDGFYVIGRSTRTTGLHAPVVFIGFDLGGRVVRTSYLLPSR